jgi:ATP-dependent DNA helicase DinG
MGRRGIAFESRPQQVTMAKRVAETLADKAHLLAEAGTGVGKSFAYLAPAMLRCMRDGERVVVATNTIALQEQLMARDIPLLQSTIEPHVKGEHPLKAVLVKGRGNYVSLRRLGLAHQRRGKLPTSTQQNRSLDVIQEWASATEDGTRTSLPTLDAPEVWNHVQSDSDNCMGRKCPRYGECFYQSARRAAQSANLLVCNHALFFSDLALRAAGISAQRDGDGQSQATTGILPEYDHVILDEAHMVEDVASDHLGASLTEGRTAFLLRSLHDPKRQKGYLSQLQLAVGDTRELDQVIRRVNDASDAARVFFDQWAHLILSGSLRTGRIREPGLVDNILSPAFRELALSLRSLRESVQSEQDRFELTSVAARASEMADAAVILVDHKIDGCVYWAEMSERAARGMRARVTLACAPVDVAPALRELLFNRQHSVVLTSATLATSSGGDASSDAGFSHLIRRLGCEGAETLLLGSPFEFARQVRLIVDRTTPEPPGSSRDAAADSNAYFDALFKRVLSHIEATQGGAFVLCTSFRTIHQLAERLADPLARLEMPLLVQGRDGSRSALLERFRDSERAVLLGAASFWQGVDVRGHALRNVTITRLPFDPPDRPLTEARGELIRARGGNPFREDALPRAIIRFKQGFGRLIRSGDDEGRVVVLDPRIATKSYGRLFLRALPEGVEAVDEAEAASREYDLDA